MTDTLTVDEAVTQLAELCKQWIIGAGDTRPLTPQNTFLEGADRNHNLKNTRTRKFLQYEEQTFGINLGWTDDAFPQTARRVSRWFFARSGGATGPLRYGEPIAVGYGKAPSFLRYGHRTVGINLGWVRDPVFEWKLLGGAAYMPVSCGDRLAIHNAKAGRRSRPAC